MNAALITQRVASAILLAALVSSGCVSRRAGGAAGDAPAWKTGVTSKRDIVAAWGNPDRIDGKTHVWREREHLGGKVKASFYGVGLTVSRMNVSSREHRIEFDADGKMRSFETVHSVPGGPSWSLIPW